MDLRDIEQRYEEIKRRVKQDSSRLSGNRGITSFSEGPPPDLESIIFRIIIFLNKETSYAAFAAKLAGFAQWSGREITEDDLPELAETFPEVNEDTFDIDLYNRKVDREDLDQWALGQGTSRIPPKRASGPATFFVTDDTVTVEEGTAVQTQAAANELPLRYIVQSDRSPSPGNSVVRDVPIEAAAGGIEYNVGAGRVSEISSRRSGIEGVTNTQPISGGEPEETQEELRERGRRSLEFNPTGVTEQGIEGELYRSFEGLELDDISVIPYRDPSAPDSEFDYPYSDVVVDGGGTDAEIQAVLDNWGYPVLHRLVRPTIHPIEITATLKPTPEATAADISTERAEDSVRRFLSEFGIGEELSVDRLRYEIIAADPEDIGDVDDLTVVDTQTDTTIPPSEDLAVGDLGKVASGAVDFTAASR